MARLESIVLVLAICLTMVTAVKNVNKISGTQHKVKCSRKEMTVEMMLSEDVTDVYLEGMKEYGKEIGCQPILDGDTATFRLPLGDFYRCGLTRVVDNSNGHRVYYQRIVVESSDGEKEAVLVKCGWMPTTNTKNQQQQTRTKRQELSDDFREDEEYDITVIEGRAPEPILGITVSQNNTLIGSDLNVQPGTKLQMNIFLDPNSTSTYGLRVSYMDVTDRKTKEETIILNGCSVDPFLFENFNTVDGDTLTAQFKAFKFPETNFVLFRGTIDVCLDRCSGVECSNDEVAYGRKRRSAPSSPASLNRNDRVFEVSMTTLVKFDAEPTLKKDLLGSEAEVGPSRAKGIDTVEQPIQSQQSQSLLNEKEPHQQGIPKSSSSNISPFFLLSLLLTAFAIYYL